MASKRKSAAKVLDDAERRDLWNQFRHLFSGPTQNLLDAVMDHCSAIALTRITKGELCLVRTSCN